jgi:Transglycosylase SLT domain
MTRSNHGPFSLFLISVSLIFCLCVVETQGQRRRRHSRRAAPPQVEEFDAESETEPKVPPIRLKLTDGSYMTVDDAWESEQGFWYTQHGVTHLASKDRVKAIVRSSPKPEVQKPVAVVKETAPTEQPSLEDRPAWIHLKGGARVEADSATESAAGVWYRRGPLSIFIERSRVDHVERIELETVASADSRKERGWSTGSARIDSLIRQNGSRHGVDPYLIFCVMEQESHFNSRAVSPKGARGLMQLMPGTAARFGVRRPHDPAQNIAGGTRYLKQLLTRFNGKVDLVLASYNAGEGTVIRYGHRVPPYRETRNYVKRIGYKYRKNKVPPKPAPGSTVSGN